ncbi:MAG: lysophospholipase [Gemmatimonadota bacterium]|jgi:lysophospholipase
MNGPEIRLAEGTLEAEGVRLHRRSWTPSGPSIATLVVVHGLSDHSARYDDAARGLASTGIAVQAFDLRGHGLSGGARGHARCFDLLLEDVDRVRRAVVDEAGPAAPLFLLGHSLGGLIAIRYLEEQPDAFRGAVIVSPWLGTVAEPPAWKVGLARVLNRIAPALPIRARIPARFLSRDPAVGPAFERDPLTHDVITPRLWSEVQVAIDLAFERVGRIGVPVLFLIAGDDRIVDAERSRAFGMSIPEGRAEVRVLEDRFHEVLNETDAADTVASMGAWIAARAAGADGPD